MTDELELCKLCKKEPLIFMPEADDDGYVIICLSKKCRKQRYEAHHRLSDAIDAWNTEQ